jgi:hypothetical protein
MSSHQNKNIVLTHNLIERRIFLIRGQKVMIDRDIALLYGVKTIALRQQVKRNMDRFPEDFMFQLDMGEVEILLSQNVIPSRQSLGGGLPYVFTEQGIAMLSSVLTSKRAIQVNIQIMRTFSKLRELMETHKELRQKIEEMEKKYDQQFKVVFEAIKRLMIYPNEAYKKTKIGFIFNP